MGGMHNVVASPYITVLSGLHLDKSAETWGRRTSMLD